VLIVFSKNVDLLI